MAMAFKFFVKKKLLSAEERVQNHCAGKNTLCVKKLNTTVHMVVYYEWDASKECLNLNADILNDGFPISAELGYQIGIYVLHKPDDKETYWIGAIRIYNDQVNNGLGTILMQELIKFARKNGIKYLAGRMSPGDSDEHASRLRHFYRKCGFTISNDYYLKLKL